MTKSLRFRLIDTDFLRLSAHGRPSQRYDVSIHMHYVPNRRKKGLVFRLELVSCSLCNFTNEGQKSFQPIVLQTANIRSWYLNNRAFVFFWLLSALVTLGGVNLYPSYKNISTDDGEYTANISQFYELC